MDYLAQVDIKSSFFQNVGAVYTAPSGVSWVVNLITRSSIILASIILLYFFILGGLGMISSAGKNDPQAAAQAKKTITSAVIGFLVVFLAYWIVKLLGDILNIPNLI